MKRGWTWCALLMQCLATPGWAGKAHEHGVARLDIAIDAGGITLERTTPLDNLLGFERGPRTDAERKVADAALAKLRAAAGFFSIDPAAGCTLASVELRSAALKLGAAEAAGAPRASGTAGTAGTAGTQSTAGTAGTSGTSGGHADLDATVAFRCIAAAKAMFVDTELFSSFARFSRIDVQVAAAHGQRQTTLNRPAKRVLLQR